LVYKSNGSMIYVAIQYRLGLLGFLAGSEVKQNGILNAGLLDQRTALEWLQRHISAFGGDPDKVTIAGESAGGGSVSYQLIAYGGSGVAPFRAAIPELPYWQPLKNDTLSEEEYQRILRNTSCMDIECLRRIPEQDMVTIAQNAVSNNLPNAEGSFGQYASGDFVFGPVVDGDFIRGLPTAEFKAGHYYRVPIMTNHESAEGNIFTYLNETASELPGDLQRLFNQPSQYFLDTLMELYPIGDYESIGYQRAALFGDLYIDCGTLAMATSATQWGNNQSAIFKFNSSAYGGLHGTIGSFVNQPYINPESYLNPFNIYLNTTLASILQSYYVSFTKYMDPNPGRDAFAPFFPSYKPSQQVLQVSDSDIVVGMDGDNGIKCYFYQANPETTRN
jgi:carboxylesterase type B